MPIGLLLLLLLLLDAAAAYQQPGGSWLASQRTQGSTAARLRRRGALCADCGRGGGAGGEGLGRPRRTRSGMRMRMQGTSQPVAPPAPVAVRSLDDTVDDEVASSPLLAKLEQMEGIWYSDDFYGSHGREWVEVRATLVGAGRPTLVAVKAKGDANVPSGFETWRTTGGLPDVGGSEVPSEVQVRSNPNDPNGFSWIRGEARKGFRRSFGSRCRSGLGTEHRVALPTHAPMSSQPNEPAPRKHHPSLTQSFPTAATTTTHHHHHHTHAHAPGSLAQAADDKILVTAIYTSMMRHTGTFHKHKVGEGGA